jgi:hypothetical protein
VLSPTIFFPPHQTGEASTPTPTDLTYLRGYRSPMDPSARAPTSIFPMTSRISCRIGGVCSEYRRPARTIRFGNQSVQLFRHPSSLKYRLRLKAYSGWRAASNNPDFSKETCSSNSRLRLGIKHSMVFGHAYSVGKRDLRCWLRLNYSDAASIP